MLAAAAGIIGGVGSIYGGIRASRDARRARRSQEQMHQDQMGLAQDQLGFARDHYDWARGRHDEYADQFSPVLDQLMTEGMADRTPDYGLIAADTTSAFDSARGADQRQMERYGIRPGDGQWGANNRRYGVGQAMAEVGAREGARRSTANDRFQRLAGLYGIGQNLQGQAMGQMGAGLGAYQGAGGMGMGAMGQMAGMQGQRAGQLGQMAGDAFAGGTRMIAGAVDGIMNQDPGGGGGANFWAPTPNSYSFPGLPGGGNIGINNP